MQVRHPLRPGVQPVLALALAAALAACDGGTDAPVPATLTITPAEATIEEIGATRQFTAQVKDASGQVIPDAQVAWTSTKAGVATVDQNGVATAVGTGSTTITATVGAATNTASLIVAPAAFSCLPSDGTPVSLAVGASMVVTNPGDFCLTLPAVSGQEYLFGVQSISESGETRTPVLVQSSTAPGGAPAPAASTASPAPGRDAGDASFPRLDGPEARLRRARWAKHTSRMERDIEYLRTLGGAGALAASPASGPQGAIVRPGMQLGDTVTVRVRRADDTTCGLGGFDNVTVELVWKGDRAWWFDDVDNPDAFTTADWQALGDRFDNVTDPVATEYFGRPFDLDGNGVIVVVFTKALNERGSEDGVTTQGFVNPCDLLPRNTFQTSNEGEFFYHIAADPAGEFGDTVSAQRLIPMASSIIAHEYAHIIQFSRRFELDESGSSLMTLFMAEGQATLSEEVVGHRVLGNRTGQNYGIGKILGPSLDAPERDWYLGRFLDLFSYYGVDFDAVSVIDAAPEMCSWTVSDADPCEGRALWYGVGWTLLRWASDQFGDRFPGGEAEMHRRLVDNRRRGFANLSGVVGESTSFLLGHWAPMLYMDDRIDGLDPRLRMTSWNLHSLYTGISRPADLAAILRPHPRTRQTTDWSDSFTVRSPSFEWYTITTNGAAVGLRATNQSRQPLPSHMQLFMVRIR